MKLLLRLLPLLLLLELLLLVMDSADRLHTPRGRLGAEEIDRPRSEPCLQARDYAID